MTARPVWLTRPIDDNIALAADLYRDGIATLNAPLLTIEPCAVTLPESPPAGLLLTSRHAAHALPPQWTHLPVYCVGAATADAARDRGYATRIVGEGNLLSMLPFIATEMRGQSLLYLSGEDIAVDAIPLLIAREVRAERIIAYRAVAVQQLMPELRTALHLGALSGVAFFSVRTAATATALLSRLHLAEAARQVDAYCISLDVAKEAAKLPWRSFNVAYAPTREVMLEMIRFQCSAN